MTQDFSGFEISGQRLLGRSAPARGAVEELRIGHGLSLKDGVLTFSTASLVPFDTKSGFVPGTAPSTTDYLRADGQWVSDLTPINIIASGNVQAANFTGSAHGSNTGDQTIHLKGDLSGSGTSDIIAVLSKNTVDLTKLAQIPGNTLLGRASASSGNVEIVSVQTLRDMLQIQGVNTGDQTISLVGDITGTGTTTFATQIGTNKVTLGKIEKVTPGVLGRAVGKGDVELLSGEQLATLLPPVSEGTTGLVPAPLEALGRFLRDDGAWSHLPPPEPVWGGIGGEMRYQTDLMSLLEQKVNIHNPVMNDPVVYGRLTTDSLLLGGHDFTILDGWLDLPLSSMNGKTIATTDLLLKDAGSTVNLILLGDAQNIGNSITTTSDDLFSSGAVTLQRYADAVAISARPADSGSFYLGLSSSESPMGLTDLSHALYAVEGQLSYVVRGDRFEIGTYGIGDILLVQHDGVSVRFFVNGERRALAEGEPSKLWRGQIMLGTGAVSDIRFEAQDDVARLNLVNLLHNGNARSGDHSGWRNTSEGLTAGVSLQVSNEIRSSGRYSFEVVKPKQGFASVTSRAFHVGGGSSFGVRYRAKSQQNTGSVMARIWTSDTLDSNGFLAGNKSMMEAGSLNLTTRWATSESHVTIPTGHTYGAVEIMGGYDATSFYFDDVSVMAAAPFAPAGFGSPERHATNGNNLITNAFFNLGDDGLLGYRISKPVVRVKGTSTDRAEYHLWARDSDASIFLNHTDADTPQTRYVVTGEQMLCGLYVNGEVVFRLECFNNSGLSLGTTSTVIKNSGWKWQTGMLSPLEGTTSVQIVIEAKRGSRLAYPYLRYRKVDMIHIEGYADALKVTNPDVPNSLSLGIGNDGVARIQSDDTLLMEMASTGLRVLSDIIADQKIRKNNNSITLDKNGALEIDSPTIRFCSDGHHVASITEQGMAFEPSYGTKLTLGEVSVGVQERTLYMRTPEFFAIHRNGQHTNAPANAGDGQTIFLVDATDVRHNGVSIRPMRLLQGFHKGKIAAGDILFAQIAPYGMKLNQAKCIVRSTVSASTGALFVIKRNNAPIGSITFKPNGTLGEVNLVDTVINDGDLITINATGPEITLANIAFLLRE